MNLKNITLKKKVIFLFSFIVLSFLFFIILYVVPQVNNTIDNQAENKMKNMVESAYNITDVYYSQYKDGKIDEQTAKKSAMEVIKNMRYDKNKTGYFWINDYDGVMLMHPAKPELNNTNVLNMEDADGFKLFASFVDIAKTKGEGTVHYKWAKPGVTAPQPKISYVKGFQSWNWIIGSGIYVDDLTKFKDDLRNKILLVMALIMLISSVLIVLIIQPLNKNLKTIGNHINKLMEYDFSSELDINQSDELGLISTAIQSMTNDLRSLVLQIKEDETSSNDDLYGINLSLEKITKNSESISFTIDNLAKGANLQAVAASNCSNEVNTIVDKIDGITADISNNRALTQNAAVLVSKCNDSLNFQVEKMQSNRQSSEKTVQTVDKLSQKSVEIGEILETIKNIAEQTNLLALNASIEAARAGEMGRGFAVVAEEVRKLAEESEVSTKYISDMISDVQLSISKTVDEINVTKTNIDEGETALAETISVFKEIADAVDNVTINIEAIAFSSTEIKENASNIASDVKNIASISQETATGTKELSAISNEETIEVKNINKGTQDLANQMEKMRNSIQKFKI